MNTIKENDQTETFINLCKKLNPGDLCHIQSFDLQDVMTAIELMEPKMDSRMKIKRNIIYMNETLERNLLPLGDDISYKLLLGIFDETLACLVNWLKGDTLGQTVFINKYMHCTENIENKYLKAFCDAIKNIISFIKFVIMKASVSEEEDFYLSSSKMPLNSLNEQKVSGLLKEADDEFSKILKSKLETTENEEFIMAIQYRIKFIRNFLLWTCVIKKQIQSTNRQFKESHVESTRYLNTMNEMIEKMIVTIDLGEKAGDGKHNPSDHDYGLIGFEPYLNLPLLPPAIPRCADIEDRLPAFNYIKELLRRLRDVCEVLVKDLSTNILSAWDFLHNFGALQQSCVLSRSLLLIFYLAQYSFPSNESGVTYTNSTNSIKIESLKSSLQVFLVSSSWSEIEAVFKSEERLFSFLVACAESIFQIPITHSLNRSRQRTRLEYIIEANWELYEECTKVDHFIRSVINQKHNKHIKDIPPIFSSYVAILQFRTMLDYLICGFQLDLFAIQELPAVYFILSECILKYFLQHVHELHMMQQREQIQLRTASMKKSRKRIMERDAAINVSYLIQLSTKLKAYCNMVCGLFHMIVALQSENRLPIILNSTGLFSTPKICYNKRFGCLVNRGWFSELADFSKFQQSINSINAKPPNQSYETAATYFDACRKQIDSFVSDNNNQPGLFLESTPEQLCNIAKNNMVVARVLAKFNDKQITLHFDAANEKSFPLVKLKR